MNDVVHFHVDAYFLIRLNTYDAMSIKENKKYSIEFETKICQNGSRTKCFSSVAHTHVSHECTASHLLLVGNGV